MYIRNNQIIFYRLFKTILLSALILIWIWIIYVSFLYILVLLIITLIVVFSFNLVKRIEWKKEDDMTKYFRNITDMMEQFYIEISWNEKYVNKYDFVSLVYSSSRSLECIKIIDKYINQSENLHRKYKKLFWNKNKDLNKLKYDFENLFMTYKDFYISNYQFYKYMLEVEDYISIDDKWNIILNWKWNQIKLEYLEEDMKNNMKKLSIAEKEYKDSLNKV